MDRPRSPHRRWASLGPLSPGPAVDCVAPAPNEQLVAGAAYDPERRTWRPLTQAPVPLWGASVAFAGQAVRAPPRRQLGTTSELSAQIAQLELSALP